MLQLLKESVSSKHAERLEKIVIVLIGIEIGQFPRQWLHFFPDITSLIGLASSSPWHNYYTG
jgi:hypothetical protein